MSQENTTVIVTHQRLNEAITKALRQDPNAIIDAAQAAPPGGYEADETPPSVAEATELMEELLKSLQTLEAAEKKSGVLAAPDDQFTSLLQSYLAEASLQTGKVESVDGGGLEAQFDERDILGWAGSLFTWVRRLKPHKWLTAPSTPDPLPNTLRAAILGDWGSGLYGAPVCAKSIEDDPKGYGLLLHLGDVYYSGTESEVTNRFLKFWPKNPGAVSRACNSNHEMYSGGYGYFKKTLKEFKQAASYFALQNDHWLLVGLDTGYEEAELAKDQVDWLKGLVAGAGTRRVVLFTHHQLFAWAERAKGELQERLSDLLTSRRIFAWYWGHEHRCMLYSQHQDWGLYGRCVGHSGYPYFHDKFTEGVIDQHGPQDTTWRKVDKKNNAPGGLILEGPNLYIKGHENEYGPHGYMTLEFDGARLNEIVHAPDRSVVYERELV
jgi:hypothetical protein